MELFCDYSISNFKPNIIGSDLRGIVTSKGSFFILKNLSFSGIGNLFLRFYHSENNSNTVYELKPEGNESLGGDLRGFQIEEKEDTRRYDKMGFNFSINVDWDNSKVLRILAYGEKSKKVITNTEDLENWYKRSPNGVPKELIVDKKTTEFIALELASKKWIYIFSGGDGDYTVYFNKSENPEEFIAQMVNEGSEKELKLLEVIE